MDLVASGTLWLRDIAATDAKRLGKLMERYADLPMDLADAALVAVAERDAIDTIFTLERSSSWRRELFQPSVVYRG